MGEKDVEEREVGERGEAERVAVGREGVGQRELVPDADWPTVRSPEAETETTDIVLQEKEGFPLSFPLPSPRSMAMAEGHVAGREEVAEGDVAGRGSEDEPTSKSDSLTSARQTILRLKEVGEVVG